MMGKDHSRKNLQESPQLKRNKQKIQAIIDNLSDADRIFFSAKSMPCSDGSTHDTVTIHIEKGGNFKVEPHPQIYYPQTDFEDDAFDDEEFWE